MELNKNVSRRNFLAASAATAAGLGLAGCSLSSGSSSTTSSSSSSTGADQSILDNKDTIQLTIFSQTANWSGAQAGWGAQLLKDKFNVEVTIIPDTSGTFETLMTTPVSDSAVVLAKFTGAMVVYAVFRRSACTVLSRLPMYTAVRPSAKQHPSGHWNQCITRRPRVDRGVLT